MSILNQQNAYFGANNMTYHPYVFSKARDSTYNDCIMKEEVDLHRRLHCELDASVPQVNSVSNHWRDSAVPL